MKNKLRQIINLFILALIMISASCKLAVNKPEEQKKNSETEQENKEVVNGSQFGTGTKLIKLCTNVVLGDNDGSRSVLPDYSDVNVDDLYSVYFGYKTATTSSYSNYSYNSVSDFCAAEHSLPENTYDFYLYASYKSDPNDSDTYVRMDAFIDDFDLTETNKTLNFYLRPSAYPNSNQYYGRVEITVNFPNETEVSLVSSKITRNGSVYKVDDINCKFTSTSNGVVFEFTKNLYQYYYWYDLEFLFKNADGNLYKFSTTAFVKKDLVSSETVTVSRFFKAYPITYHLPNGVDYVDYYASTYGYTLPDTNYVNWYEEEELETSASSAAAGTTTGAKEFWGNLKSGYHLVTVHDETEKFLKAIYYYDYFYLLDRSVYSDITNYVNLPLNEVSYVYGYYKTSDLADEGKVSKTYNNKNYYDDGITKIYTKQTDYKTVTLIDQVNNEIRKYYTTGYYTLYTDYVYSSRYDENSVNTYYSSFLPLGVTPEAYYSDAAMENKLSTGTTYYPETNGTVYVKLQKKFTKKLSSISTDNIYRLPVNGTNCKVVAVNGGFITDDYVYLMNQYKNTTWSPSLTVKYTNMYDAATYSYSNDDLEEVTAPSDTVIKTVLSGAGNKNINNYIVVDTSTERESIVFHKYYLTEGVNYRLEQVNSGNSNFSYLLSGCTNAGVTITNVTTGEKVLNTKSASTMFTVPETGMYTICIADYEKGTYYDFIKIGYRIAPVYSSSSTVTVKTGDIDVVVTGEGTDTITLTADEGYASYEWSLGTGTKKKVLGTTNVLTLNKADYQLVIGEPLPIIIEARLNNNTIRRRTFIVKFTEEASNE